MEEYITACPRNCYSTCTFRVQIENSRIKRILPYSENRATPEGPCVKGLAYIERSHSAARIIFPLIKNSNGSFSRISSALALDMISDNLESVKSKYGSQSILWYTGSGMSGLTNEIGHYFWKAFGGTTITYGNLCWPAGLEAVRLTLGTVKHNVPWDIVNAKTIIIWGKNPAETNIQEIAFISKAKENGSLIIVIDPVRSPTADKADIFISPKPGTDGALALAIAKVLIDIDLIDKRFIDKYVKGFNEFRNSLFITPGHAEQITGIPSAIIIELANIIGTPEPVTFIPGYGLQRHINGGQTIRSILSLAVITGNIGKPGSGFNYANLQSYIYDNPREPITYYPDPVIDFPFRRTISMARLGADLLKTNNPEINALWIERGNPLLQSPDTNLVREAFSKVGFKVVVEQFMTDTAEIADIILPAKNMFEQSDIIGSYWSPYVQFKPKVIEPPGEVMPESEIYYNLAKRLNLNVNSENLPEPGNDNIEEWLERRINGLYELTLNDLRKGPVIAPGLQLTAYEDMKFETPSGKIELYSDEAKSKWAISPLPDYSPADSDPDDNTYPLVFITSNTGSRIHSQFGNLQIIKDISKQPAVGISPFDAEKRNISSGCNIRVYNKTGEIISVAIISNRVPSGILVLPNGIWIGEGGGGNYLISGKETDIGYGAAFHDNKVEVERVY